MMRNVRRSTVYLVLVTILLTLATAGLPYPSAASLAAAETAVSATPTEPPTQQIIVQYRTAGGGNGRYAPDSPQQMQTLSAVTGVELTYFRPMSGDAHVLRLPAPLLIAEVETIAAQIESLPDVAYAEPDRVMSLSLTPDDPQYGNQWHYFETYGIYAPAAWDITTGSAAIRVAVLDSGITDHVDLAGRWLGGYDFITNIAMANDSDGRDPDPHDPGDWVEGNECFPGSVPRDSSWHGTHVAGTIGAASNNGLGVAGVNWVSPIVPVRVVGKCGGLISDIADGMRWSAGLSVSGIPANPYPAQVLNMSLGGPGVCSSTYQNAINAINAVGGIIVVAAGNNSANLNNNSYQPANCNGVITVAATDRGGDRALYSNYGAVVKISAPGGENVPTPANGVLSTSNTGLTVPAADAYRYYQGTSMAAPHVTGIISLLLSLDPTLTLAEVIQILQSTARPFPTGSGCNTATCGSGIVDAAAALNTLPPPPPTATPTHTPLPPTATPTNTAVPPTATNTPLPPTATNTPVPPTATPTNTAVPPTATNTPLPPTATNTPLPPTATPTNTAVPPTATNTAVPPTATNTPLPPTATPTNTAVPPTATNTPLPPTATNTPLPPTATPTNTGVPPTATNTAVPPTATNTAVPPTATNTPLPPTATPTNTAVPPTATNTPLPPTATNTPLPSTATPTHTAVPPTATNTPLPPTATNTPVPPTATPTNTAVPPIATNTPLPPTATNTPLPPTATPTNTGVPPTATNTAVPPTATNTAVPPTATNTPLPPTATPTNTAVPPTATNTPLPPTATNTPLPSTATPTHTAVPPTATNTAVPPTATNTPLPPTATPTNTAVPPTATNTAVPPTATNTSLPPTTTPTNTAVPPTATNTPLPPTVTPTNTAVPPTSTLLPPTATSEPVSPEHFIYLPVILQSEVTTGPPDIMSRVTWEQTIRHTITQTLKTMMEITFRRMRTD